MSAHRIALPPSLVGLLARAGYQVTVLAMPTDDSIEPPWTEYDDRAVWGLIAAWVVDHPDSDESD